jgi:hypothetical protein
MRGGHTRLKLVTATVAVGLLLLVFTSAAIPAAPKSQLVVRATVWPNLVITFSPKTFKHGTVVIKVKNRSGKPHQFTVNGVNWPVIQPGTVIKHTVTFKRRGTYTATLPDCGYLSECAPTANDVGPTGYVKVT